MTCKSSLLIIWISFISCKNDSKVKEPPITNETLSVTTGYYSTNHLIECEHLKSIKSDSNIKIIDFRKPEEFFNEHIDHAINIWRTDIENESFPYKGMMASKTQIETLFSSLGIKNNDELIIYDDSGACDASRLWWILKNYGFNRVKILNGGLTEWRQNGGKLTSEIITYGTSNFKLPLHSNMSLYIGLDEMKSVVKNRASKTILDTRTADEFSGKRQKKGASRGGHIPTSLLLDWVHAIDYHETKKFKPYNELLELYNKNGITKNKPIYVYCHSGVRSAHTSFVLTELLGHKNVKNYDGSWVEWSYHKDLPIKADSLTTIFK